MQYSTHGYRLSHECVARAPAGLERGGDRLALVAVGYLGVKLIRPPWWLIAVLLLGGFLLADSVLAPVIDNAVK
ncbi:hypothetical protein ACIP6Q_39850 [Streptomyces bobili]|uniref:hypothetical protein n=1 Tax=Streptomyces bobili TaxID=67280 RepID=UPI003802FB0B